MRIHLVNVSSTAGGVLKDLCLNISNPCKVREINRNAMRLFLAGHYSNDFTKEIIGGGYNGYS